MSMLRATVVSAFCVGMLLTFSGAHAECKGSWVERFGVGCENAESLREQDDLFNRYYQAISEGVSKRDKGPWRQAQRGWLKTRNEKCKLDVNARTREDWFKGIEGDPEKLTCVMRLTQERIAELESRYGNRGVLNARKFEPTPAPDWEKEGDGESVQKYSSPSVSKGKYYFEVSLNEAAVVPGRELSVLIGILGLPPVQQSDPAVAAQGGHNYFTFLTSNAPLSVDATGYEVIGVAADLDTARMFMHDNGKWLNGEPGTAGGGELERDLLYRAQVSSNIMLAPMIERGLLKINFGSEPFRYPLPTGYRPFE